MLLPCCISQGCSGNAGSHLGTDCSLSRMSALLTAMRLEEEEDDGGGGGGGGRLEDDASYSLSLLYFVHVAQKV